MSIKIGVDEFVIVDTMSGDTTLGSVAIAGLLGFDPGACDVTITDTGSLCVKQRDTNAYSTFPSHFWRRI